MPFICLNAFNITVLYSLIIPDNLKYMCILLHFLLSLLALISGVMFQYVLCDIFFCELHSLTGIVSVGNFWSLVDVTG